MFATSHLKTKSTVKEDFIKPPLASRSRSSSSSSCCSFDESYFCKTYVPLSSLPTPPPTSLSSASSCQQSPSTFSSAGEIPHPELLGPAIHLTNLIPSSTSLTAPSVPSVHTILTRADLPIETIALAVCILDSLNSRFALQWRKGCPLTTKSLPGSFSLIDSRIYQQHIDSIHPEIIVLGALILAVKFLDDAQQPTTEYATKWGNEIWTCEQINFTQRSLLENLGYRLLPLWEQDIILEALEDMERAGQQYMPEIYSDGEEWDIAGTCFSGFDLALEAIPGDGKAVIGLGNRVTPVETSRLESTRGTKDVDGETRGAFLEPVRDPCLHLPDRPVGKNEPFPLFIEPTIGI